MYSTTKEYLDALRRGDYLSALKGWSEFLVGRYNASEGDGDLLLQLSIFELIRNDFSADDFRHIQVLYALLFDYQPPFVERISFNATLICNAAMQYMVFYEHGLLEFYKTQDVMDAKKISAWLSRSHPDFPQSKNSDQLMLKYTALNTALSEFMDEAREIRDKINYILETQCLLKAYGEKLANVPLSDDFSPIRLGLIHSLEHYLKDKTMPTMEVLEMITTFGITIKKMDPYAWEKEILDKILPKTGPEKPIVSWFFDKSAENFHFFAVKVLNSILPNVKVKESVNLPPKV